MTDESSIPESIRCWALRCFFCIGKRSKNTAPLAVPKSIEVAMLREMDWSGLAERFDGFVRCERSITMFLCSCFFDHH